MQPLVKRALDVQAKQPTRQDQLAQPSGRHAHEADEPVVAEAVAHAHLPRAAPRPSTTFHHLAIERLGRPTIHAIEQQLRVLLEHRPVPASPPSREVEPVRLVREFRQTIQVGVVHTTHRLQVDAHGAAREETQRGFIIIGGRRPDCLRLQLCQFGLPPRFQRPVLREFGAAGVCKSAQAQRLSRRKLGRMDGAKTGNLGLGLGSVTRLVIAENGMGRRYTRPPQHSTDGGGLAER